MRDETELHRLYGTVTSYEPGTGRVRFSPTGGHPAISVPVHRIVALTGGGAVTGRRPPTNRTKSRKRSAPPPELCVGPIRAALVPDRCRLVNEQGADGSSCQLVETRPPLWPIGAPDGTGRFS